MGQNHARVITANPRTKLEWIVDKDLLNAKSVASKFEARAELAPNNDIDAVVIATPTPTHAEIATSFLKQGIPLLIEKPIAESFGEVNRILDLAKQNNVVVMCGLVERFNPITRTLFDIVEDPIHIRTVRHSPPTPRIQSSVAFDLLVHDVDIVLGLFKTEPEKIISIGDKFGSTDDIAEAVFQFVPKGVAALSASRRSQTKVREIVVCEENRMIFADLLRHTITISQNKLEEPLPQGMGYRQQTTVDIPMIQYSTEPLVEQLNVFCDMIHGSGDFQVDIERTKLTHQVMCQIADAMTLKQSEPEIGSNFSS